MSLTDLQSGAEDVMASRNLVEFGLAEFFQKLENSLVLSTKKGNFTIRNGCHLGWFWITTCWSRTLCWLLQPVLAFTLCIIINNHAYIRNVFLIFESVSFGFKTRWKNRLFVSPVYWFVLGVRNNHFWDVLPCHNRGVLISWICDWGWSSVGFPTMVVWLEVKHLCQISF